MNYRQKLVLSPDSIGSAPSAPAGNGNQPAGPSKETETGMLLLSREGGLLSEGVRHRVQVPAVSLGTAVAQHFRVSNQRDMPLLGALPFDRSAVSHLFVPQRLQGADAARKWLRYTASQAVTPNNWELDFEPSPEAFQRMVAQAVACIGDKLGKVVLARTLLARSALPINPWWVAEQLGRDPTILRYVLPLPASQGQPPAWLVGASPELLLSRRGRRIASEPLAGSAARSNDNSLSQARADALQRSSKADNEHRQVVEAIADQLAPLCRHLHVPAAPELKTTASMWHLGTRIEGELKDPSPDALAETSSAALAALLHPTPAVCGTPRDRAAETLTRLESRPRGFYAGALGHCQANGDGDWHLSLRCARIEGHEARLYAGAGIVTGSDPVEETEETGAKFHALLDALGIDPRQEVVS